MASGGEGYRVVHWNTANGAPPRLISSTAWSISSYGLIPVDKSTAWPVAIGLNSLDAFRTRYEGAVGLSDHSGTIFPAVAAATLGVDVIEVHITMSREMFGPDVPASVTTAEFAELVRGVRFVERMRAAPVDKSVVGEDIAPLREIFLKSVVATADLPAGTVLERRNITTKKPGTGIPASAFDAVIGRILARPVQRDVPLLEEDLEDPQ